MKLLLIVSNELCVTESSPLLPGSIQRSKLNPSLQHWLEP